MNKYVFIKSVNDLHKILGFTPPKHPGISYIPFSDMKPASQVFKNGAILELYMITLKESSGKIKYGQTHYDFDEGSMLFSAPNQILYPSELINQLQRLKGWCLFFHSDLLFKTQLQNSISNYSYFEYTNNEGLHLSAAEKDKILSCVQNISEEYNQNLDTISNELIVNNLQLLLNYCKRFYNRQFITRRKQNQGVVDQLNSLLHHYFESNKTMDIGLPTVKYCAEQVNLSPNYLSDLLKKQTGKNTKEHIDYHTINKAKNLLLGSSLNISQVAYSLGFENAKSFSNLFKRKEGVTPSFYRNSN